MSWQLLVTVSVLTYAFSVLLQRALLKDNKSDPIAYSVVFGLLTGAVIAAFALTKGFYLPLDALVKLWPNLVFMVLGYGIGNILVFNALKLGGASEFTIVFATRAFWSLVGAALLLLENITFIHLLGTVFVITSVVVASWQKGGIRFSKGFWYAAGAALCIGLAFTNDAFILREVDMLSYLALAFVAPSLAIWLVFPRKTKQMLPLLQRGNLAKLIVLAVTYAISAITIFAAYQVGNNATQIAPLSQTATIVTVLLSIFIFKERDRLGFKLVGALLSFVGVLLLI